ncbi:DUF2069 domain-containing protein [Catenovulum sp. 2E275]|uniref:DUF2069 domain-containing protein n=1 Tax=Catenovulum sp. 2E275 TaxID=2980497 RepID=UPI0021D27EB0|nr:DUF2069 domain-containing protein [Catenovulum sp. 2E275]MCU4676964.1 DUF2069 domain-containing protein [Catenovulum sp. 2E275]
MTEQDKQALHQSPERLKKIKQCKTLALVGYLGLFVLIPIWHVWLAPPLDGMSVGFVLTLWLVPLLFPLKGMITGKAYTYAWSNFICMFYFLHSLTLIYASESERYLALAELILACCWFTGASYYARYQGQYQGLGLKKLKKSD